MPNSELTSEAAAKSQTSFEPGCLCTWVECYIADVVHHPPARERAGEHKDWGDLQTLDPHDEAEGLLPDEMQSRAGEIPVLRPAFPCVRATSNDNVPERVR